MSIKTLLDELAKGIGVFSPEDVEKKLRKIRKLEARVVYQDRMGEFESIEEYNNFVDSRCNWLEGGAGI